MQPSTSAVAAISATRLRTYLAHSLREDDVPGGASRACEHVPQAYVNPLDVRQDIPLVSAHAASRMLYHPPKKHVLQVWSGVHYRVMARPGFRWPRYHAPLFRAPWWTVSETGSGRFWRISDNNVYRDAGDPNELIRAPNALNVRDHADSAGVLPGRHASHVRLKSRYLVGGCGEATDLARTRQAGSRARYGVRTEHGVMAEGRNHGWLSLWPCQWLLRSRKGREA